MRRRLTLIVPAALACLSLVSIGYFTLLVHAGPRPKAVNLQVTLEDTLFTGEPTQIRGDGADYVNGEDGVLAQLTTGGGLMLNLWPQSTSGVREASFNHNAVPGVLWSGPAPYASGETGHPELVKTPTSGVVDNAQINAGGDAAIQDMAVGAQQCLKAWWGYRVAAENGQLTGFRDTFHYGLSDTSNSFASYAVVTRLDNDTWRIESSTGTACPNLNQSGQEPVSLVAHTEQIVTKKGTADYGVRDGYYYMPFRLTLRRHA